MTPSPKPSPGPRKPAAKKAITKKPAAKKPPAKKAAVKKPAAKKSAAKKPAAKKPAAKKSAAKKSQQEQEKKNQSDPFTIEDDLWGSDWSDLEGDVHSDQEPTNRGTDTNARIQTAAHDLIGAARDALDLAEELLDDPTAIGAMFESVRSFAIEFARGASQRVHSHDVDDVDDDFQFIRVEDGD